MLGCALFAGCSVGAPGLESVGQLEESIVFGQDNRLEFGALTDPRLIGWANATAALFPDGGLTCSATSCTLGTSPLAAGDVGAGTFLPLCSNERFRSQQAGAGCTGFLVGPDLVATAGHCVQTQAACETTNVVFGFSADASGGNVRTSIPRADIYACVDLVAQVFDGGTTGNDWALFRVDRQVTSRTPIGVRRTGSVPNDATLVAAGHLHGLPLKITTSGGVRENFASAPKFQSNLDASPGNSGSPVINLVTGLAEGIITSGPTPDWQAITQNGTQCATARVCSDTTGCGGGPFPGWTDVTRISGVVAALEGRSCFDDTRNGQETDVDCGGPECPPCALGQACALDRDCPFRDVCEDSVCVEGPECTQPSDCLDPVAPSCIVASCVANECNLDYSACECTTNAECDDGRACTQDLCFARTLACIHIETNCEPACTEQTAIDLGSPGTAKVVPNNGCVRVRDGYPSWWGTGRRMMLQTNAPGSYPVPFTWTNSCAGGSGNGTFTGNWQKQFLNPTSAGCATLIDLKGSGSGNVSLWYFGE
jgi:hypothetical protein